MRDLTNGRAVLARRSSVARVSVDTETRHNSDAAQNSPSPERALRGGIDVAILERLLSAMDPDDRDTIRDLCAIDLEKTRCSAWLALRRWDRKALGRHLHVMSSLAQTVGADRLADEAARLQARLRSGGCTGFDAGARRMDELARRAVRFLEEPPE